MATVAPLSSPRKATLPARAGKSHRRQASREGCSVWAVQFGPAELDGGYVIVEGTDANRPIAFVPSGMGQGGAVDVDERDLAQQAGTIADAWNDGNTDILFGVPSIRLDICWRPGSTFELPQWYRGVTLSRVTLAADESGRKNAVVTFTGETATPEGGAR